MKKITRAITFFILMSCVALTFASDLNKAFKYLNTGDYPNAVKYLREVTAEDPGNAAANYGLAKYFFAKDNPAHHLDSANTYIKLAAKKIPLNPDDKETKRFLNLGVRDYTIQTLQKDINYDAYSKVEKGNTIESYQYFLDNFSEKGLLNQATNARNQLAYIKARAQNDPKALDEFVKKYPDADQVKEAKELYEKLLYRQTTSDQTYQSYKKYMDSYPQGEYVKEARKNYEEKLLQYYNNRHDLNGYVEFEKKYKDHPAYRSIQDSIFSIATAPQTVAAFENFVKNYSDNPHIAEAWQQLYQLYTADATEEVYRKFSDAYPQFPDKNKIDSAIELAKRDLKPFQQGDKWGYAYQPTKDSLVIFIPGEYEEAFDFNCGLAAVRIKPCNEKCTYFYINKNDKRAIDADYNFAGDFHAGYAVVGIGNCEEEEACRYGIIDIRGQYVVPPIYDILDDQTEGLYLASQHDKFGFINKRGDKVISFKYSDALPFSQGAAAVAIDDNWFFIDNEGRQLFINRFHNVSSFSDSLCAVTLDGDNWGYIDLAGNFVIDPQYDNAEDFENGFAVISKKEKDPKNKGLLISQRYKIDKTGKVIEKLTAPKSAKTAKKRKGRK